MISVARCPIPWTPRSLRVWGSNSNFNMPTSSCRNPKKHTNVILSPPRRISHFLPLAKARSFGCRLRMTLRHSLRRGRTKVRVRQGEQLVYTAAEVIPDDERQIEQTENQISLLLGKNPGPVARSSLIAMERPPPEVPAGLTSVLLERRPEITATKAPHWRACSRVPEGPGPTCRSLRSRFLPPDGSALRWNWLRRRSEARWHNTKTRFKQDFAMSQMR